VVEFNPVTLQIVWEYGTQDSDEHFFSQYISGVQRLPNGNTLITVGTSERIFEVTPDRRVVWDYVLPAGAWIYRAYRIPPEWLPEGENYAGYADWSTIDFGGDSE